MPWLSKNRIRFFVAGMLVFALLLLQAGIKNPNDRNWMDRALMTISAPLQNGMVWVVDGAAGLWKDYVWLVDVQDENSNLRRQVADLERQLARQEETQAENERLTSLVEMRHSLAGERVRGARVVGVGTSPAARVIRINLGSDDGVKTGQAVLAGAGLVGRVSSVIGGYAEVLLLVDVRSAVDVIVQRSRIRGIARGQGLDEGCTVDHVVRTADIRVGDRLVTSGLGGLFPKGLLVGTVIRTTAPDVGVFRGADMKPAVDFEGLEEVLVVLGGADTQEASAKEADPKAEPGQGQLP